MNNIVDFCNRYRDNDYLDSDTYEELNNLIDIEFPNAPFSISLEMNEIKKLDHPFTSLDKIIILDGRISNSNYYYADVYENILNELNDELVVKSIDNNPITLRQVLNAMINDTHYNKAVICRDDHRFLEGFESTENPSIFISFFGS